MRCRVGVCIYLAVCFFFPPTYFVAFSSAWYCDWNELGACALWCFTQDVQFQPGELALNHYNTLASPRAFHSLRGRGAGQPARPSGEAPRCGGAAPPAYTSRRAPGQGPPVAAMTRGARPAAEAARQDGGLGRAAVKVRGGAGLRGAPPVRGRFPPAAAAALRGGRWRPPQGAEPGCSGLSSSSAAAGTGWAPRRRRSCGIEAGQGEGKAGELRSFVFQEGWS